MRRVALTVIKRPSMVAVPHLLQMVMLRNEVCDCRASGVFLRLSAQGLIAENNIHSNGEAGLDIRKGANPIIVVSAAFLCYYLSFFFFFHCLSHLCLSDNIYGY